MHRQLVKNQDLNAFVQDFEKIEDVPVGGKERW